MADFTFHNVGQGLFYTGKIDGLNIVYDCGTDSERNFLDKAIQRYKANILGDDPIDILVISHFDRDHVIGLDLLLDEAKVRNVFIPYLSPIERLVIALSSIEFPAAFYEFLADTVSYLLARGIERVIIVGGIRPGEEGGAGRDQVPNEQPPEPDNEGQISIALAPDPLLETEIRTLEATSLWLEAGRIPERVMVRNHKGLVKYNKEQWEFVFFSYKGKERISGFRQCLEKLINGNLETEKIRNMISNKADRDMVRRGCYTSENPQEGINNTSLVLCHGPVGSDLRSIGIFLVHVDLAYSIVMDMPTNC